MRVRERERERVSKCESEVAVERKKVPFPSSTNPSFGKVHAELSRNFRKKLRYNPGFPASAMYNGSHSREAGLRSNFREKKTVAAPSRNFREDLSIHLGGPFI